MKSVAENVKIGKEWFVRVTWRDGSTSLCADMRAAIQFIKERYYG